MSTLLFDSIRRCFSCEDIGITISNSLGIHKCWRITSGAPHNEPNDASLTLHRTVENLIRRRIAINPHTFQIAAYLCRYSSAEPCKRDRLSESFFQHASDPKRALAKTIETLRHEWLMPIGSRKELPSGYWIITDVEDFSEWVDRSKAAPITQLTTIYAVAKRNFPVFAGQMNLDFLDEQSVQELSGSVVREFRH